MRKAVLIAKAHNIYLTPLREDILNVFMKNRHPLKAYDIIKELNHTRETKPIVVYRIINFLLDKGVIHKIESKKSFILCSHSCEHEDKPSIFFIM